MILFNWSTLYSFLRFVLPTHVWSVCLLEWWAAQHHSQSALSLVFALVWSRYTLLVIVFVFTSGMDNSLLQNETWVIVCNTHHIQCTVGLSWGNVVQMASGTPTTPARPGETTHNAVKIAATTKSRYFILVI